MKKAKTKVYPLLVKTSDLDPTDSPTGVLLQVNPSAMAAQTEVVSSTDSVVKYPGQEGLYTSVGLTSSADVTASVRGETWCPMALA